MENISLFIPQNLNLREAFLSKNASQTVYSYGEIFFLRGNIRSGFSVISQKRDHLLK